MLSLSEYRKYGTLELAEKLIGCTLVHRTTEGITSGIIVETEAYLYDDPSCHAFNGITKRNTPMFEDAGIAYVYFIYGMYHCFNIVSGAKGKGEAVLIRALQPIEGVELMKKRRKTDVIKNLCNGPAKLVIAMGITKENNCQPLDSNDLYCIKPEKSDFEIIKTTRIGISMGTELPYRFYMKNNGFISKK